MNKNIFFAALVVYWLFRFSIYALGPHECAIIVNKNSEDSKALANFYADLRLIPPQNVIHLDLPDRFREAKATISPNEFRQLIYEPVMTVLKERQLTSHVLVWLYSLDFPSTVSTDPPMSLTGMTFVRGQPPETSLVRQGLWPSQLFRGPDRADGPAAPTVSLEQFTLSLTTNMPVPSMLLGWSGSRGMTLEELKQQLKTAASSDGSHPTASAYFEVNDNARSTTRQWQFDPAKKELGEQEVLGIASEDLPHDRHDLMGVLAGRQELNAAVYGPLKPGAYADHLTGGAAVFHTSEHTKLIAWLQHGAAGSAGTVIEPGSLSYPVAMWAKFPSARFFTHYASGATLIESLYQSIRSPLQILLVGDALCAPWAMPLAITLECLENDEKPLRDRAEFVTSNRVASTTSSMMIMYLLDGKPLLTQEQRGGALILDTNPLTDGHHYLRAIAYDVSGPVRHQGLATRSITAGNRERYVQLSGYAPNSVVDAKRPLAFTINAAGQPERAAIVVQERLLLTAAFSNGMTVAVDPREIGPGPVDVQAVVVYPDREAVRSKPLQLQLDVVNHLPDIISITRREADNSHRIVLRCLAKDQDGDELVYAWYYAPAPNEMAVAGGSNKASEFKPTKEKLRMAARTQNVTAVYELEQPNWIKAIETTCSWKETGLPFDRHRGGIVFNVRDERNYLYWGLDGSLCAWTLKRVEDGREENVLTRGAPIRMENTYRLRIALKGENTLQLMVNDRVEAETEINFGHGHIGVLAGTAPVYFQDLRVTPPSAVRAFFQEVGNAVMLPVGMQEIEKKLHASVTDLHGTSIKK